MVTSAVATGLATPHRVLRFPGQAGSLPDLSRWLAESVEAAEDAPDELGLIVEVTGDVGDVASGPVAEWSRWEKALRRLERLPRATVGVVDGAVTGPAFHLLLTLDLVFATPQTVVACRDLRRGLLPGMALHRLAKYTGMGHAKRLLFTAEPLPVAEALRLGLVSDVSADPWAVAREVARRWSADDARTWYLSRRLLGESYSHSFEDALGGAPAAQERALREKSTPESDTSNGSGER